MEQEVLQVRVRRQGLAQQLLLQQELVLVQEVMVRRWMRMSLSLTRAGGIGQLNQLAVLVAVHPLADQEAAVGWMEQMVEAETTFHLCVLVMGMRKEWMCICDLLKK